MGDFFQIIIDALFQEYGRRHLPGWIYALGAIVSISGAITASEIAKKRKRLRASKLDKLATQVLTAHIFSKDGKGTIHHKATLKRNTNEYSLKIEAIRATDQVVKDDVVKHSIEDIELYLRENTHFLLSDFKPGPS
ncbi:MAG: hypothetical protein ACQES2_11465 [Pseudomonadota bacterium]